MICLLYATMRVTKIHPKITLHRKILRDSKFGNALVIHWYNIGKSLGN